MSYMRTYMLGRLAISLDQDHLEIPGSVRSGGAQIEIPPKQWALLAFLLLHGKTAKQELMNYLWPVHDDASGNLTALIGDLRESLQTARSSNELIARSGGFVWAKAEDVTKHDIQVAVPQAEPLPRPSAAPPLPPLPRNQMVAMFLLFDEELINNREGRGRANYDPRQLAYWLNFYFLFFDKLCVPANFLLDNNLMAEVFDILRLSSQDSPLRSSAFQIVWDTSRFGPAGSFRQLLDVLESDATYITLRQHRSALQMAERCEVLKSSIVPCSLASNVLPKESIKQLELEVFDKKQNQAHEEHRLDRLQECLQKLVQRGDLLASDKELGYGRNFYYSLWGYGTSVQQRKIEKDFRDITQEYLGLRHDFLTAVDYVSHSLKTRFTSHSLGRQVDIVIPKEYARSILRPEKTKLLGLDRGSAEVSSSVAPAEALVSGDAVRNLTGAQLRTLHASQEFGEYRKAMTSLSDLALAEVTESRLGRAQDAFNRYLRVIERVLSGEDRRQPAIRIVGHVNGVAGGAGSYVSVHPAGAGRQTGIQAPQKVELCSGTISAADPKDRPRFRMDPFPQLVRLCRDVKIYLT